MQVKHLFFLTVFLLIGYSLAFGQDSHQQRVAKAERELNAKRDRLLQSIETIEISLQAYEIDSEEIAKACALLEEMTNSAALWRNFRSRETRTRRAANAKLENYLSRANVQFRIARRRLELVKQAEFDAWARKNPGAAKLIELERRIQSAQSQSVNAQQQAEQAQRAASRAQAQAEHALWEADSAGQRARRAEEKAQQAEDQQSLQ